ncbi:MAG: transglycosylase SLT domain-containing protein [Beijerinckiaceae bacterium]
MDRKLACTLAAILFCSAASAASPTPHPELDEMIARHARNHGIPEKLVHRVVMRESRYNPKIVHSRFYGLMQITYETAKSMGYKGPPSGLLDPDVNLTYAVPYLANAYKAADGNENRAVVLYAAGYYFTAKRKKILDQLRNAASPSLAPKPPPAKLVPIAQKPVNPVVQSIQFIAAPGRAGDIQGTQAPEPAARPQAAEPSEPAEK